MSLKGYKGIGPNRGKFVEAEDAFFHAANECGVLAFAQSAPLAEEFKHMLVEWYFSGNWVEECDDEQ